MTIVDHVILGVNDLDAATRRLETLGLGVVDGGRHRGLGTANRIVPLGAQYLELLGIVDRAEAERSDFGRALAAKIVGGDRLVRWCLAVADIDATAKSLGLAVEPRSRVRPDGVRLTWRAAGLSLSLVDGWLPFFVAWDDPAQHPGATPITHPCGASAIARVDVATDDRARLARWLGDAPVPVRVVEGVPGLHAVALATRDGQIVVQ